MPKIILTFYNKINIIFNFATRQDNHCIKRYMNKICIANPFRIQIAVLPFSIIFLFLLTVFSCKSDNDQEKQPTKKQVEETLMGTNQLMTETEKQQIKDFIDRRKWDMQTTGSGLYYMIYEDQGGQKAKKGMIASIDYEVSLITGDVVYSSDEDGLKEFRIGKGGVETGLEEAILLLSEGDKAVFILPSHLAHGVTGDGKKIPRRATIIYDVELIKLK